MIHGLGDRRYGVWSLVESVIAYLSLFDLGIAVTLVRFAARFEAQRDWRSFNRIYSTSLSLFVGIGALVLGITLCLALGWERPLGAPADLAGEIRYLLILLGINLALGLPLGVFPTLFDALGQYPVKVAIRTFWSIISASVLVAGVRAGYGLIAVGLVITVCSQAEHLMMAAVVHRLVPELHFSVGSVDRKSIREIWGNSAYALLAMIAGRISFQTDALVIGGFMAPQFITYFMIAARLVEYSKDAVRALTMPFTSAISAHEANEDTEAIRQSLVAGTRAMLWLTVPLQAGLVMLGHGFLSVWVGPIYAASSYSVLVILAIPLTLSAAQFVAGRVLYGLGRLRSYATIVLAEAVINLVLSLTLIQPLGIQGVALGTSLPNLVANILVIVMVCRIVHVGAREYLVKAWLKPTILGCALTAVWLFLSGAIPITSWKAFFGVGFLGAAGYAIVALWCELGANKMLDLLKNFPEGARLVRIDHVEVAEK